MFLKWIKATCRALQKRLHYENCSSRFDLAGNTQVMHASDHVLCIGCFILKKKKKKPMPKERASRDVTDQLSNRNHSGLRPSRGAHLLQLKYFGIFVLQNAEWISCDIAQCLLSSRNVETFGSIWSANASREMDSFHLSAGCVRSKLWNTRNWKEQGWCIKAHWTGCSLMYDF